MNTARRPHRRAGMVFVIGFLVAFSNAALAGVAVESEIPVACACAGQADSTGRSPSGILRPGTRVELVELDRAERLEQRDQLARGLLRGRWPRHPRDGDREHDVWCGIKSIFRL